jgi:hemerythrin
MRRTEYTYWQPEFSVGVEEIDNQHKELLNLVNDSINHSTGNTKAERNFFDKIIRIGIDYLKTHFSTEEQIMIKTGYHGYGAHKTEHDAMVKTLTDLIDNIESGKTSLNLLEFSLYLRDWFLNHIPAFDKPAEEYFKQGANVQSNLSPETSPVNRKDGGPLSGLFLPAGAYILAPPGLQPG